MEGVLNPIGPEDARTYWIRRGAALAILVILMIGVGVMISSLGRADGPVAEPAANNSTTPEQPEAATPPGEPSVAPAPTSTVVEDEAVPQPSSARPQEQQPAQPSAAVPPVPDATPTSGATAPSTPRELPLPPEPENTFHRSAAPTGGAPVAVPQLATTQPAAQAQAPAVCDPTAVQVTLDGPRRAQIGVPVSYRVAATNTAERDCVLTIDDKSFELKIYSGSDRIWSSLDCVAGLPPRSAVLARGHALEFNLEWRANRSAAQCRINPEPMNSGTYVATAQLAGAKPAQLVMQVTA